MKSLQLSARQDEKAHTIVEIKTAKKTIHIGEGYCTMMAGPCAVESREQYLEIANLLKDIGVDILRGGAFKPRTSPYSFQGLGEEGLKIMAEARALTDLPIVSELTDIRDIDLFLKYVDIIQIGSRNMQNFPLLKEVGKANKAVVLKRGLSATIEEWLLATEYILNEGNSQVILCERGIRSFEPLTRNTVDIGAISLIKELSHLPIILDPSHATGRRKMVQSVAKAAVAAGADGLIIEVHQNPEQALSDGAQSLHPFEYRELLERIKLLVNLEQKIILS